MPTPQTPPQILIDVRTPSEFLSGALSTAINIEYQLIDQLPHILAQRGISVKPEDPITLYCRSGRRSGIARERLREMGFSGVRDIGGLEEARAVLLREGVMRGLVKEGGVGEGAVKVAGGEGVDEEKGGARKKALGDLLEGLRGLE